MKRYAVILFAGLLAACNPLTLENYDKLRMGMSYEQVSDIIGKSQRCEEQLGTRSCVWGDDDRQISVVFVANRATLFSHKGLN
jgi:hypothetical protein